jgi:chaperonin cofactor prefoldin
MSNKVEKMINELDWAIEELEKPDCDFEKIGPIIIKSCQFMTDSIKLNKTTDSELEKELSDAYEAIDALTEENELLQIDIQIILEFLKKNNIDISYIVNRSEDKKK